MSRKYNTGNPFIAPFASLCDYCSNHIAAGDSVTRLLDDRYICTTCVQAGVEIQSDLLPPRPEGARTGGPVWVPV